jgi:hypothetical protein
VNLLPHFTGENKAAPHDALYWRWIAQSAIREGKWKLLVGGARSYLFDLETDPGEKRNLSTEQPEVAKRLRARLEAWATELQPPGVSVQPMGRVWEDYFDHYLDGKSAGISEVATAARRCKTVSQFTKPRRSGWTVLAQNISRSPRLVNISSRHSPNGNSTMHGGRRCAARGASGRASFSGFARRDRAGKPCWKRSAPFAI